MTPLNNSPALEQKTPLLTWILLVSVVLNLFLVGVLAGIPGGKHKFFGPMALSSNHGEYTVEWVTHYLNSDDASVFRAVVQLRSQALKQAHQDVHQAIQKVAAVFEQDPQDAKALKAAIDHLNEVKSQMNDIVGQIIQEAYPKLSADGRHRLAELTR